MKKEELEAMMNIAQKTDPTEWQLDQENLDMLCNWINENILPRKTVNNDHSSYGLKHIFERDTKLYVTNNQFKYAMLICGFIPSNPHEINWFYAISQKSPAFQKRR